MPKVEKLSGKDLTLRALRSMRFYLGLGTAHWKLVVDDPRRLAEFLNTRSSHVAQTSLYGYLKARAGMRYPTLFEDDAFLVSVNRAKWQVWLACLSDLSVYAGGLVASRAKRPTEAVAGLIETVVADVLAETGIPEEAGPEFPGVVSKLRGRIAGIEWSQVTDDEMSFCTSPGALVHWAPVIEDFKKLDDEIVRNSMRFRWPEVRRELRQKLDAESLLRNFEESHAPQAPT